jgi:hypothetical protein
VRNVMIIKLEILEGMLQIRLSAIGQEDIALIPLPDNVRKRRHIHWLLWMERSATRCHFLDRVLNP